MDKAPHKRLAAHDAEVAKAAFLECVDRFGIYKNHDESVIKELTDQYVAELRTKAGE